MEKRSSLLRLAIYKLREAQRAITEEGEAETRYYVIRGNIDTCVNILRDIITAEAHSEPKPQKTGPVKAWEFTDDTSDPIVITDSKTLHDRYGEDGDDDGAIY